MGTLSYTVFDGEVTSEYRNGVLKTYAVDPLGSTIALIDNTQTITDTFSYTAFGEVVNHIGTTPTPFQYVGSKGYYKDSNTRTHVRARNFYVNLGKWSTQDPIWYRGGDYNLYRYVGNNPLNYIDKYGLSRDFGPWPPVEDARRHVCSMIPFMSLYRKKNAFRDCVQASRYPGIPCDTPNDAQIDCMMLWCRDSKSKIKENYAPVCCGENAPCAQVLDPNFYPYNPNCKIAMCTSAIATRGCNDYKGDPNTNNFEMTLLHEMWHCCGVRHGMETGDWSGVLDLQCNDTLACCMYHVIFGGDAKKCKRRLPPRKK